MERGLISSELTPNVSDVKRCNFLPHYSVQCVYGSCSSAASPSALICSTHPQLNLFGEIFSLVYKISDCLSERDALTWTACMETSKALGCTVIYVLCI